MKMASKSLFDGTATNRSIDLFVGDLAKTPISLKMAEKCVNPAEKWIILVENRQFKTYICKDPSGGPRDGRKVYRERMKTCPGGQRAVLRTGGRNLARICQNGGSR